MIMFLVFFFFKQKTAYEMRISDWSSDVCSSDLIIDLPAEPAAGIDQGVTAFIGKRAGAGHRLHATAVDAGTAVDPKQIGGTICRHIGLQHRTGGKQQRAIDVQRADTVTGIDKSTRSNSASGRDRKSTRLNSTPQC